MFDITDSGTGIRTDADLEILTYLVIDDSSFSRKMICNALHGFGLLQTIDVEDAVEGLDVLRRQPVDVVLVDYEMPIINGVEFTRLARRDPDIPNQEVPIIMISGNHDREKVVEARNAGIHEYLAKPFSPGDLYKRIVLTIRNPRPFIRAKGYIGPDRRWLDSGPPGREDRRREGGAVYPDVA